MADPKGTPGAAERMRMKAIKEEARRQVHALVKDLGFDDVPALKAHLAGTGKPQVDKPSDDSHARELEEAKIEATLRETLLDAGVRRKDLDFVVSRFVNRVRGMDEETLKAYDVPDFVTELATEVPMVFVEGRVPVTTQKEPTAEEKAAADAKAEADSKAAAEKAAAEKAGTAKAGADTTPPGGKPPQDKPFNAMTATKAEVEEHWAAARRLRGTAPQPESL